MSSCKGKKQNHVKVKSGNTDYGIVTKPIQLMSYLEQFSAPSTFLELEYVLYDVLPEQKTRDITDLSDIHQ
jgi:hypothetical protein